MVQIHTHKQIIFLGQVSLGESIKFTTTKAQLSPNAIIKNRIIGK